MKYQGFFISALRARFAYRSQVWAALLGQLIEVLIAIAIWQAVYAGRGEVAGASLPDMVTYAILAGVIMSSWDHAQFVRKIGDQIKSGDVAVFLLKPVSYPLMLFAAELGELAFSFLAVSLPVSVVIGLIYGFKLPPDTFHALMFVAFFVLAFVLFFLVSALFGMAAFWLMTVHALEWFLGAFINILAGVLVPLWFFPAPFDTILRYQPLAFLNFHPAAVYLGKTSVAETMTFFAVGLGWIGVLLASLALLWSATRTRLVVQGG